MPDDAELMRPGEVAELFNVDPKTVSRWANARKLTSTRTLGKQRRFYRSEVMEFLEASRVEREVE